MAFDINLLKSKKPRILSNFDASECSYESIGLKNTDESFCLKSVRCKCGNDHLNVIATVAKETKKSLFKTKEIINYLAPLHLECPKCKSVNLIFDPEQHGWDGENGDCASITGEDGEELFNQSPAKVYVEISYQGEENYEDLAEDGISNIEDYFDTFNLYIIAKDATNIEEVVAYECA